MSWPLIKYASTLSVSSPSYLNVDVVSRYLTQDADLSPEAVERELVVTGSDLMLLVDKRTGEVVVRPSLPLPSPAFTHAEAKGLVRWGWTTAVVTLDVHIDGPTGECKAGSAALCAPFFLNSQLEKGG